MVVKLPDFTAAAVLGNGEIVDSFNFAEFTKGKKAVVFFYPLDFTFVCPSELIAFDKRFEDFQQKVLRSLVFLSILNSHTTHGVIHPSIKVVIGAVKYPLVADVKHEVVKAYDVEHPEAGVAFRGSFLIDEEGVVRHQVINDFH
ncbi:redoxin domain-containing protein [Vibrio sp. PP-XX7]